MRRFVTALLLTLAFGAGCVASQVVVPRAQAGTGPVRWEYSCIDGWSGVTHSANQLGKEGWEMAAGAGTSDHMMWCFKKQLP
jgi:hypothetical protein